MQLRWKERREIGIGWDVVGRMDALSLSLSLPSPYILMSLCVHVCVCHADKDKDGGRAEVEVEMETETKKAHVENMHEISFLSTLGQGISTSQPIMHASR